jgi:hypothetical protein
LHRNAAEFEFRYNNPPRIEWLVRKRLLLRFFAIGGNHPDILQENSGDLDVRFSGQGT